MKTKIFVTVIVMQPWMPASGSWSSRSLAADVVTKTPP